MPKPGNVAGVWAERGTDLQRALHGAQIQDERKEAFERQLNALKAETEEMIQNQDINKMFEAENQTYEQKFKESIIGLVTRDDFIKKREYHLGNKEENIKRDAEAMLKKKRKKLKKGLKRKKRMLTFDEEEDVDAEIPKKKKKRKISKNPKIDTSFLPDADRDREDDKLKEQIRKEYYRKQEELKEMTLEMTFSYWDGSNHRRTMRVKRGMQIGDFLEIARKQLEKNFYDLRGIVGTNLMFVKDDLIIPHGYSFHDLISSKAVGKSKKELFPIEVWEDIEEGQISAKETGVAGKVVTRSWYERNKHIYPGNKWATYDPSHHSAEKQYQGN